jgi:hypothetical protein
MPGTIIFSSRLFSRPLCWRHKLFLVIETHLVTMARSVDELGKDSDARGLIRGSTNLCDLSIALETVAFNDATPAEVLNAIPNPRHLPAGEPLDWFHRRQAVPDLDQACWLICGIFSCLPALNFATLQSFISNTPITSNKFTRGIRKR